jgi:KaiC/GvpD/RAD55 family RecA-like ATPase
MALTEPVKTSVDSATAQIREALSFAGRNEHPMVINSLAEILMRLDSIHHAEQMIAEFDDGERFPDILKFMKDMG